MELTKLIEFCKTERQKQIIQAVIDCGNNKDAAKKVGIDVRNVQICVARVNGYAKDCGYDPDNGRDYQFATGNQPVSGYSTLVRLPEDDPHGRVLEWVKTSKSQAKQQQEMQIAAEVFVSELPPREPKQFNEPDLDTDLIPWFNIGDGHIGMLAHDKEVGESFDLKIAEAELCESMSVLIDRAPQTERCVIQDMGTAATMRTYLEPQKLAGTPSILTLDSTK